MTISDKTIRLKSLMKGGNVNISELAELAGYNRQHVTTILNGKGKASPRFWALIRRGWAEYRKKRELEQQEISTLLEEV